MRTWPVEELCALTDPAARAAVVKLLRVFDDSLDDVQTLDLDLNGPDPESALQDAYIGIEDLGSALLEVWFGDTRGNEGSSTIERLESGVRTQL